MDVRTAPDERSSQLSKVPPRMTTSTWSASALTRLPDAAPFARRSLGHRTIHLPCEAVGRERRLSSLRQSRTGS